MTSQQRRELYDRALVNETKYTTVIFGTSGDFLGSISSLLLTAFADKPWQWAQQGRYRSTIYARERSLTCEGSEELFTWMTTSCAAGENDCGDQLTRLTAEDIIPMITLARGLGIDMQAMKIERGVRHFLRAAPEQESIALWQEAIDVGMRQIARTFQVSWYEHLQNRPLIYIAEVYATSTAHAMIGTKRAAAA